MSTFDETVKALQDDAELRARVMSATSAADRNAILTAAGLPVPAQEDLNAKHAALADVTGAGSSGSSGGTDLLAAFRYVNSGDKIVG